MNTRDLYGFGHEEKKKENSKFEPCPKCGGDYQYIKCSPGLSAQRYSVHCRKCGTHTKYRFASETDAINAWNRRKKSE